MSKMTDSMSKVEWVTPAMAAEWVKRNTRNRAISKAHVASLADEIKSGAWRMTHQGIAFGEDGTLFDGQHRLHAIIAANIAVPVLVTHGLNQLSLDAIDTGNVRRAADVLAIADGKHVTRLKRSATLGAMMLVQRGRYRGAGAKTNVAALRAALDAFEANFDALDLSMRTNRLAQAPVFSAMLVCHALHPASAVAFARVYRDPSGSTKHHPAVALREHVLLHYAGANLAQRTDVASRTFSAFHAFRNSLARKHVKAAKTLMLDAINAWRASREMSPLSLDNEDDTAE